MQESTLVNYHEAALDYLKAFCQSFVDESCYFGFHFISELAREGDKIAQAKGLEGMDYENAMLIIYFRFAGNKNMLTDDDTWEKLLHDFANQINYPKEDVKLIEEAIRKNIIQHYPTTIIEEVAWDALGFRFAMEDLILRISFLKEEINHSSEKQYSELEVLTWLKEHFVKNIYITEYGKEHYTEIRDKNFQKLDKRILKLQLLENRNLKGNVVPATTLSDKQTEDLFKIAFRNYAHLVSVADAKAGLLIRINTTIISVIIAFLVSRSEKYLLLNLPSLILLPVAFITIVLAILASRPQNNRYIQDKNSKSYQTFFFGSFDLIGNDFAKADWSEYSLELDTLLKGGKEKVYEQMYKETFNVRKVLGRKFSYLSIAYWVFTCGLFASILAFFINNYLI